MRHRIPSTVIRHSPILLYILIILVSNRDVECFTRPTTPPQIPILKGSSKTSNLVSQYTSTSLQKKQHTTLYITADENNDGETILASSPDEQQPTTKTDVEHPGRGRYTSMTPSLTLVVLEL